MQAATQRGEDLGLNEDEICVYDALAQNEIAVQAMGNDELKVIADNPLHDIPTDLKMTSHVGQRHHPRQLYRVLRECSRVRLFRIGKPDRHLSLDEARPAQHTGHGHPQPHPPVPDRKRPNFSCHAPLRIHVPPPDFVQFRAIQRLTRLLDGHRDTALRFRRRTVLVAPKPKRVVQQSRGLSSLIFTRH